MTIQVRDEVSHEPLGVPRLAEGPLDFAMLADAGETLFHPRSVGLKVQSRSKAMFNAYHCGYAVRDGRLLLTRVTCGLTDHDTRAADRGEEVLLFGRPLVLQLDGFGWGTHTASGLAEPVDFTGGMILGHDDLRIPRLRRFPTGYPFPFFYRTIRELTFDRGALVDDQDRSAETEAARQWCLQPWSLPWYLRIFAPREDHDLAAAFTHRYRPR